ncbi:MAG: O-antigen ligase family protein [Alphaproteobacteria bacterium]|nr:O-antigen ligase family protein [Alphaproteobacteria bacterium]
MSLLSQELSQAAWTDLAASALLFLYPILLLAVREGVNFCFALLVVLALWCLTTGRASFRDLNRGEIAYAAAMASLVIATALSQTWHWHFRSAPYDDAIRYLLAVPVYLMLRSSTPRTLASLQYGIPLGAITAALLVLPQLPLDNGARASTPYMDAIRFGDLALALGVLSITSVDRADSARLVALKIAGAAAALFASIESGTRGGWIALPLVALAWWLLRGRGRWSWRPAAALVGLLTVLAVVSYFFVGKVHDRMVAFSTDVVSLFHADLDTSLGLRLQIWRVAIDLFAENPVFGVGPDEFKNSILKFFDLAVITREAAHTGSAEVHSQILLHAVSLGIFGVVAIVSIYIVPLVLFIRAATASFGAAPFVRSAAVMGGCFVISFLVFGLTVEIFNLKLIATFYSLTVAVLLAATAHRAPA